MNRPCTLGSPVRVEKFLLREPLAPEMSPAKESNTPIRGHRSPTPPIPLKWDPLFRRLNPLQTLPPIHNLVKVQPTRARHPVLGTDALQQAMQFNVIWFVIRLVTLALPLLPFGVGSLGTQLLPRYVVIRKIAVTTNSSPSPTESVHHLELALVLAPKQVH